MESIGRREFCPQITVLGREDHCSPPLPTQESTGGAHWPQGNSMAWDSSFSGPLHPILYSPSHTLLHGGYVSVALVTQKSVLLAEPPPTDFMTREMVIIAHKQNRTCIVLHLFLGGWVIGTSQDHIKMLKPQKMTLSNTKPGESRADIMNRSGK